MPLSDSSNAASLITKLREDFIERMWVAAAVMAGVAAVVLPLRALLYLGWNWATNVALIVIAVAFAGFFLRRRMSPRMRGVFPVSVLMFAACGAVLRNGLQDNGIAYLVLVNVMVAALFGRRAVLSVFGVSILVVLFAAWAFTTGLSPLHFGLDYAASAIGWVYTIAVVFSLAFVVLTGIGAYRRSLQHLIERVVAQREEIARLADHDSLTGATTPRVARDRLQMACNQATRNDERVAVLFIDLDGFKQINDAHGHRVGDLVLQAVATRLAAAVRTVDTVARQGGDEFVVILTGIANANTAEQVAAKMAVALAQPITYDDTQLVVGASIGIAIYPDHAATPEGLLHAADQAMYKMKSHKAGGFAIAG
jgi:diguanylate cyclase (GGDEF)-like protein